MRLRDVKVGMKVVIKGKLAMVDQLLVAPSVNKWSLTVRIKQDGYGLLINHRELRPYVEPKQEPAKTSPAVGSAEWAEEQGRAGKKIVGDAFDGELLRWIEFRNDGKWYYSNGRITVNGVGPLHPSWGSEVWRIYEDPAKKADNQDSPPWQPSIRLPADPTEAAIRVIEYRIARVRKESSDKICALESTIEELRKGWNP